MILGDLGDGTGVLNFEDFEDILDRRRKLGLELLTVDILLENLINHKIDNLVSWQSCGLGIDRDIRFHGARISL